MKQNLKKYLLGFCKYVLPSLLAAGIAITVTLNVVKNNNAVAENQKNENIGKVENYSQTNSGTNYGAMVGKLEVMNGTLPSQLNDEQKLKLMEILTKDKTQNISIGFMSGHIEAKKLAEYIQKYLVSKGYKTSGPEGAIYGGCELNVCVEEYSVWVN